MSSFKCIRQNPSGLASKDFINFIKSNNFITCPWGHSNDYTDNVWNGKYNIDAKGQDKRFVEELKVGDYIVIPIEGKKKILKKKFLLKIVTNSELKCKTFRTIYAIKEDGKYVKILNQDNITNEFDDPKYCIEFMKMTYKECENLGEFPYDFDSRKFPRNSFSNIKKFEIINNIKRICNNIF